MECAELVEGLGTTLAGVATSRLQLETVGASLQKFIARRDEIDEVES